jgi:hypothetical protein
MTSPNSGPKNEQSPHEAPDLTPEVLSRCAELLATGEIDWPSGLSDDQELALLDEVRRFRRARLVKFVASQIAADIAREEGGRDEAP